MDRRKSKLNSTYKETTRDSGGSWASVMRHSYANPEHIRTGWAKLLFILSPRAFLFEPTSTSGVNYTNCHSRTYSNVVKNIILGNIFVLTTYSFVA